MLDDANIILLFDKRFFAGQNGSDGSAEPFAQAKRHGIAVFGYAADGYSETNGGVEHPRPVHVQRDVVLFGKFSQLKRIHYTNRKL